MADEVCNANVVRITRDGDRWVALIGPDPQLGLMAHGPNPVSALLSLAIEAARLGWPFDPTWTP